ncbi:hypothetical protein NG827_09430 [Xanthomonas sacchari]|uniref:hypothetical protein n=1 Tax=Xanthomonas TaxID=338 RepID=UPI0003772ED7|nr:MULTISPECIES: hypothetical protein [Xanthomonas]UYK86597.1 hypothetical protein NG827_09430 [Xanthomonas sacchari]
MIHIFGLMMALLAWEAALLPLLPRKRDPKQKKKPTAAVLKRRIQRRPGMIRIGGDSVLAQAREVIR